jgi:hypothetical protein
MMIVESYLETKIYYKGESDDKKVYLPFPPSWDRIKRTGKDFEVT